MEKIMNYYKINNVALASEVELNGSNGYADAEPITFEQYLAMINPEPIPINELEVARAIKAAQLATEEEDIRTAGYLDETIGLKLFLGDADTIRYTQFKTLHLNDFADTVVEIGTHQGWQPLSNAEAQALLDRYGRYAEGLYKSYSDKRIALMYATTIEQIEAI